MSEEKSCQNCANTCRKCKIKKHHALHSEGMAACAKGALANAETKLREALELARELGMVVLEANTLNSLGIVSSLSGGNEKAETCYIRALELVDGKLGEDHFFHRTLNKNLAEARALG